jgi:protein-disulfide isomerase
MYIRFSLVLFLLTFFSFAKKPIDVSIQNQTIYRTKEALLAPMSEDISLGQKNAKVKVVVFDSYSCIHCGKFYDELFPILDQNYIKTNKVHFVNKEFPIDSYSVFATKAVQCSPDKLTALKTVYKNQEQWLSSTNYEEYLMKLTNSNKACIEKYDEKAAQKTAFEYSKVLNLKATPTVFVNGKQLEKLSKKNLLEEIEKQLKS